MWRAGHPLQQSPQIGITDLRDLRSTFLTSQDFGLLRQLMLETNAIAMLPDFVVRHELKTKQLRRIKVTC